jgi:hypothetical protein
MILLNKFVIFGAGVVTGLIIKSVMQQQLSIENCPFDQERPHTTSMFNEHEQDADNKVDEIAQQE